MTDKQSVYGLRSKLIKVHAKINLFTKQKKNYKCRKETYGYQGVRGGINWRIGIDIHTLLYIK